MNFYVGQKIASGTKRKDSANVLTLVAGDEPEFFRLEDCDGKQTAQLGKITLQSMLNDGYQIVF